MPIEVASIRREHVEAFLADLLDRFKPATAVNRYRALKRFFGWLVQQPDDRAKPVEQIPGVAEPRIDLAKGNEVHIDNEFLKTPKDWFREVLIESSLHMWKRRVLLVSRRLRGSSSRSTSLGDLEIFPVTG